MKVDREEDTEGFLSQVLSIFLSHIPLNWCYIYIYIYIYI